MQAIRSGWVFSPAKDLLLFLVIPVLALGLTASGLKITGIFLVIIWIAIYLDSAHNFLTFLPIYASSSKQRLWLGTVLYTAAFSLLYLSHELNFQTTLLLYGAAWHFARQQYGWMRISARKANEAQGFSAFADKVMLYNVTLLPILLGHSETNKKPWFTNSKNPFTISAPICEWIFSFYIALIAAYVLYQAYRWISERKLNYAKQLIIFSTAFCWYVFFLREERIPYFFLLATLGSHQIGYYWIVREDLKIKRPNFMRQFLILTLGLAAIAYTFSIFKSAFTYRNDLFMKFIPRLEPNFFLDANTALVFAFLWTPTIGHYLIDAFIWKNFPARSPNMKEASA